MVRLIFHHVGIAVSDLQQAIPNYKDVFGYKIVSGPFDDPIQKVSVCFLSRGEGDATIELVAPLGPNSPIDGTLKRGGGTYHICYEVDDISAAIRHLTSMDICTERPSTSGGLRDERDCLADDRSISLWLNLCKRRSGYMRTIYL